MKWLDNILGIKPTSASNPDAPKVRYLIRYCTNKDLLKIAKEYISVDGNPKIKDKDTELYRKPTRDELERSIISKVPVEVLVEIVPKLKPKLKQLEENEN